MPLIREEVREEEASAVHTILRLENAVCTSAHGTTLDEQCATKRRNRSPCSESEPQGGRQCFSARTLHPNPTLHPCNARHIRSANRRSLYTKARLLCTPFIPQTPTLTPSSSPKAFYTHSQSKPQLVFFTLRRITCCVSAIAPGARLAARLDLGEPDGVLNTCASKMHGGREPRGR